MKVSKCGEPAQIIEIKCGDLTKMAVDAVVNAANTSLLGGGGVDGALHRAAGPELLEACRPLGGCQTGQAKITPAFALPAKFVIHAVGPVWRGGTAGEARMLKACYLNALKLASQNGLSSIAFPCISTGAYGYPKEEAAQIALGAAGEFLRENETCVKKIYFVCFSSSDEEIYKKYAKEF